MSKAGRPRAQRRASAHAPLAARALATRVLLRVEETRAHADVVLGNALAAGVLDARDRGFATRLVYGTLAWQGRLDWHLATLAERDPAGLDSALRIVLRLGLYQLLFLDRVPPHAAVATSVDLAKRLVPAGTGLVNAVLRRATREGASLTLPDPVAEPLRHLAVACSHPEWLVALWQKRFDTEELRALLAADNETAPTVLRARTGSRDALISRLTDAGIAATPCRFAPDGVQVTSVAPHALSGFAEGAFSVQSEASQLVARLLGVRPGMRVLDACAAPGGKATYLAELMEDRGLVLALDRRLAGATAIALYGRRLGLARLVSVAADARMGAPVARGLTFDRILVDAPCSGLGTLRAHPEVRWSRSRADLAHLATRQRAILEGVTPLLAPGGALVYATCTISTEENDDVVRTWLDAHPSLEQERAEAHLPAAAAELVDDAGVLRTFPHRHGLDGFYAVRVRRRA